LHGAPLKKHVPAFLKLTNPQNRFAMVARIAAGLLSDNGTLQIKIWHESMPGNFLQKYFVTPSPAIAVFRPVAFAPAQLVRRPPLLHKTGECPVARAFPSTARPGC